MSAERRILLIQTQAENAGAQEISRLLAEGLEESGYEIYQLFFFRRTASYDDNPRVIFCAEERPTNPWAFLKLLHALFTHLRALKPNAVLTFQHYGNIIGGLAARLAGLRPVIASQTSAPPTMSTLVRWLDRLCGSLGVFNKIIVNSEDTLRDYETWPPHYRRRLIRIDHGFEDKTTAISKEEARQAFALPQKAVLLGCVARFHPLKQLDAAVRLLPLNPGWHLALAGQGSEQQNLEALAAERGCTDRLHLTGELPPARIGAFLAALDVFVFPSLAETFGLAAVEAAQAGVPVVANRLRVLEEVLRTPEGEPCARFVDAKNTEEMSAAVQEILNDPALADSLRSNSRSLKEPYALTRMIGNYEDVIGREIAWTATRRGHAD